MLTELSIRSLAIIDELTLTLGGGFNVLTGETGAGKSIMVEALALLCGGRGSADDVRTGRDRLVVAGTFEGAEVVALGPWLADQGLALEGGRLVLRREVSAAGRSRAWVNDVPVTTGVLSAVGGRLINIHGQHDARGLLDPEVQRDILDRFAGAVRERDAAGEAWDTWVAVQAERADLARRHQEAQRRADYLRHVVREIGEAHLVAGEDARLDDEARRLAHVEELRRYTAQGLAALDGEEGTALDALGQVRRLVAAACRLDPTLAAAATTLEGLVEQVRDVARELAHYEASLDADPARLAQVEQRRDLIYRLTRKHGETIEQVLEVGARAQQELDLLESAASDLGSLAHREARCRTTWEEAAAALSARRREAAGRLARAVDAVLPELGLAEGHLRVLLTTLPTPTRSGTEDVSFDVTLNAGHDPRPLARVASGGELSRVMLALTTVLTDVHRVPTLVFDEVDAGVGGRVAVQLGALLARVATSHQVLVITHLAQVAAQATSHVVVTKGAAEGVTTADLRAVQGRERVREVARMLGGGETPASIRHARELLHHAAGAVDTP